MSNASARGSSALGTWVGREDLLQPCHHKPANYGPQNGATELDPPTMTPMTPMTRLASSRASLSPVALPHCRYTRPVPFWRLSVKLTSLLWTSPEDMLLQRDSICTVLCTCTAEQTSTLFGERRLNCRPQAPHPFCPLPGFPNMIGLSRGAAVIKSLSLGLGTLPTTNPSSGTLGQSFAPEK